MKRIKPGSSLEKENQSMKNISIMEDDNNEAKMEDVILKVSETGDYEKLHKLSSGISFEAGNLRQPEISSENEKTLHAVRKYGRKKNIEILIKDGANLEARDKLGCTALHFASLNGHYLCVKQLLKAGADCSVPVDKTFSLAGMTYIEGLTPLHLASTHNHVNCVKLLIQFGANCEAVDINGRTSLYIAAEAGYSECVLTHLRYAHTSSFLSLPSYDISYTPLHFAVENGMLECVKELVHLGSNVNHINRYGFSPLHCAYNTMTLPEHTAMQILKILVLEGHNTDMNNALHQDLFYNCCSEAKVFLITHGANINIKNEKSGLTFLEHELCDEVSFGVVKCIVNSMLQVPHLTLLDVYPITFSIPQEIMISEGLVFSKDVDLRIVIGGGDNMYIEIIDAILEDKRDLENINKNPVKPFSTFSDIKRVPLKQPFLNVVYEHIKNELKKLNCESYENCNLQDINVSELMLIDELLKQKQMLYYEIMASTPRTLKHCCRFSIRKCMSPSNLLNINKLPLPKQLLSYLFFE